MRSYQVGCPPGSVGTLADMVTLGGGGTVTIKNNHASVAVMIGGDENEDTTGQKIRTPAPVSLTTGWELGAGKILTVSLGGGEALYGRSTNATVTVSVSILRSTFPFGSQSVG